MSDGEVRKVSRRDIQLVQNLIERCLQLYMNQREVVETLELNARIEPGFTELVWQKLEEENREFFKAYHTRLMLKNQIIIFNQLLEKQVELMQGIHPSGSAALSLHGDSNPSLQETRCYSSPARLVGPSRGPINTEMPPMEPISTNFISAQNSETSILHGMNGRSIKMEPSTYPSNPEFSFCSDTGFSDCHVASGDVPMTTFGGSELHTQPMNNQLVDVDTSSFGILGQIPRNFSFSDLTEDFTQSSDILESYGRSPFLETEPALSSSAGRGILGERKI